MSEYWKSAERYWCKHCQIFIRDTPLERRNHEATGKHQGNLKRFLRDIHRNHEREEREKSRAQREIDRLNGVKPSSIPGPPGSGAGSSSSLAKPTEFSLAKQREQLAAMGVVMPGQEEKAPEVAAPGEWTVTNTRVVEGEGKALGVRKREVLDEEQVEEKKEEEEAVGNLFKRQKKWGRDSKVVGGDGDEDLDALLTGGLKTTKKEEEEETEEAAQEKELKAEGKADEGIKTEDGDDGPVIKKEPEDATAGLDEVTREALVGSASAEVKQEDGEPAAGVVFKKRKTKQMRQK